MGDVNQNQHVPPSEYNAEPQEEGKPSSGQRTQASAVLGSLESVPPFYSQLRGFSQQQRADPSRMQPSMTQYNPVAGHVQGASPYNMGSVAAALPEYGSAQSQAQRGQPATSSFRGPQYPSNPQFGGAYGVGHYGPGLSIDPNVDMTSGQQGQRQTSTGPMQSPYSPYAQQMPQYYYPAAPYSPHGQQQAFYAGTGAPYDTRANIASSQGQHPGFMAGHTQYQGAGSQIAGIVGYADPYNSVEGTRRQSSEGTMTSIPRGPPRKPKQSGHALWVGNLPPGTTVLDLKDHFSRDATKDIESLFLISKSNCAFVNYRTEASCAAAMQRFHDSRFHGVRLVCRLRRSSAPPPGVPLESLAMTSTPTSATPASSETSPMIPEPGNPGKDEDAEPADDPTGQPTSSSGKVPEKYFIVKSLTLQDLDLSLRNGIWATQSHNEEALNKAYQSAESVYLIFSANKSGEYFGYARMTSPISEDAKEVFGTIPRHEPVVEPAGAPRTIPTAATEFAPKGHIIDDSARGTIFWEADHSDQEQEEEAKEPTEPDPEASGGQQAWGKPFKIEWMSTNRLPFYRTRGLRNPWNANREVKIARDGTELEPGVGNRLVQMFHRMGQPAGGIMAHQMGMPQMPAHMAGSPHLGGPPHMGGLSHMRPYG